MLTPIATALVLALACQPPAPIDVDAEIRLAVSLTREGRWAEALEVLTPLESRASDNADLLAALARAYRRAGDDGKALDYFTRAKALAPADPELIAAYEAVARVYGHFVGIEGFGEGGTASNATSGSIVLDMRIVPRLHVRGRARVQGRAGTTDTLMEGGALWRVQPSTTLDVRVAAGPDNTSLPTSDVSAQAIHYSGSFELGGQLRRLSFDGVDVVAVSPTLSWDRGERWRFDGRYTYSRASFDQSGETSGDHSVMLRETWRGWRRIAVDATYAYGIESFEDLTTDRISALGSTTLAAGVRVTLPALTQLSTTWERQWRADSIVMDRITVAIVRAIP